MSEITHIVAAAQQGDSQAAAELLPLVYAEEGIQSECRQSETKRARQLSGPEGFWPKTRRSDKREDIMKNPKLTIAMALLPIATLAILFLNQSGVSQSASPPQGHPSDGPVRLQVNFRFSGTFIPTAIDANKDGLVAEMHTAQMNGVLKAAGPGKFQDAKLATHTGIHEYGLLNPATDTCTSCFRVNEHDFSVQENAYNGPIANLLRPIRDPVANPSSSSYAAEEWTTFYSLETGELIFAQVTMLQICVENTKPIAICHVRSTEKIVGGTGRFKNATGDIYYTAIAPTYTADAPLLDQNGCLELSKPLPTFSFGPIYGAGQMSAQVQAADAK
jgi:hypothetical protein